MKYIYSANFSLCSYNGAVAQCLAYWLSVPEAGVQLLAVTLFKVTSWKAVPFHYFSRKNSVERAYVLKWFIRNNSSTNTLSFNKNQSKNKTLAKAMSKKFSRNFSRRKNSFFFGRSVVETIHLFLFGSKFICQKNSTCYKSHVGLFSNVENFHRSRRS